MSVCFCARWLVPVLMAVPLMFVIGWFTSEPLQGQDVDAVQKRLLKAVAKHRELSLEQAAMMMRVLRDSTHQGQADSGPPPTRSSGSKASGSRVGRIKGRQDQGRRQPDRQHEGRPRQPNREGRPANKAPIVDRTTTKESRASRTQSRIWSRGSISWCRRATIRSVPMQISEEDADHQRSEAERWMESQHRDRRPS